MKTTTMLTLVTLTMIGCSGSAQLVRKDPAGGRVALSGAFMPAMGEAHLLMAEHCRGRFDAIESHDAVLFRCRNAEPANDVQVAAARVTVAER